MFDDNNNNKNTIKRIEYIDFLKFVGLTGIFIGHVSSPQWAIMLRNFDVPLMIILSAILGELSYKKYKSSKKSIVDYYKDRIKRLVIPTWIFLVLFFVGNYLIGRIFSIQYYVLSFLLTTYGTGYVWIFLLYLYSALAIPFLDRLKLSIEDLMILIIVYIVYEAAYYYELGTGNKFFVTTFYYFIPYGGILTYIGYNYHKMKNSKITIPLISLIAFILIGFYYWHISGSFQNVQISKYPPRCYYLSYGIMVSFLLLNVCEKRKFKIYKNIVIKYIAKHSMWIYLWHIALLGVYKVLHLPEIWYIKLFFVYITALLFVFIVNFFLDLIEARKKISILKYLRG